MYTCIYSQVSIHELKLVSYVRKQKDMYLYVSILYIRKKYACLFYEMQIYKITYNFMANKCLNKYYKG